MKIKTTMKVRKLKILSGLTVGSSMLFLPLGCSVEQEESTEMPEVSVDADSGNLPEYEVVQEEEGELPSVDVNIEGGQLPEYDIDMADVDVGTTTETMTVPKVKIVMEEEEFEVPYIDVDMPGKDVADKKRQPILAVVETPNPGYELNIRTIYLADEGLIVVSEVTKGDVRNAEGKAIARDAVVVDVPDVEVFHYIISDISDLDPRGSGTYRFFPSSSDVESELSEHDRIYSSSN